MMTEIIFAAKFESTIWITNPNGDNIPSAVANLIGGFQDGLIPEQITLLQSGKP